MGSLCTTPSLNLNYGAVGAVRAGAMSVDEKRGCLSAVNQVQLKMVQALREDSKGRCGVDAQVYKVHHMATSGWRGHVFQAIPGSLAGVGSTLSNREWLFLKQRRVIPLVVCTVSRKGVPVCFTVGHAL